MKEGELFAELIDERRIWFSTFDHCNELMERLFPSRGGKSARGAATHPKFDGSSCCWSSLESSLESSTGHPGAILDCNRSRSKAILGDWHARHGQQAPPRASDKKITIAWIFITNSIYMGTITISRGPSIKLLSSKQCFP